MDKKIRALVLVLVGALCLACGFIVALVVKQKNETKEADRQDVTASSLDAAEHTQENTPENEDTGENTEGESSSEQEATTESPFGEMEVLSELRIDKDPSLYTYEDLLFDEKQLLLRYPEYLTVSSLGTTYDQREIKLFVVGSTEAKHKILIFGGIHAREYMTCQLVMKQLSEFLRSWKERELYGDMTYDALMEDVAVYAIPMVNPDGTSLSQFGMEGLNTEKAKKRVEEIAALDGVVAGESYLRSWKANANGVDLNRNFDALWEQYSGAAHASSDHYKGESAGCETEAKALIDLTVEQNFERTISYHAMGGVIYWYFGQEEPLYSQTNAFANRIGNETGYYLDANYQSLDPAGYKDWAIMKQEIPSITIEIGSGSVPLDAAQFSGIWKKNQNVWQETILSLQDKVN